METKTKVIIGTMGGMLIGMILMIGIMGLTLVSVMNSEPFNAMDIEVRINEERLVKAMWDNVENNCENIEIGLIEYAKQEQLDQTESEDQIFKL